MSPYRVSTIAALGRQVDGLALLVTGVDVAPGLEGEPVRIGSIPSIRLQHVRHHPSGYSERYEVHVPVGTLRALRRESSRDVFVVELGLRTALAVCWRMLDSDRRLIVHADLSEATERGRGWLRTVFRKALIRRTDTVMVNGRSGARYLRSLGCPEAKIGRLPYASDMPRFGGIPDLPANRPDEDPLRLLYVGRLAEVKGLVPFVERLAAAVAARPERAVVLTMVGDGEQAAAIDAIALPANLRIDRVGAVDYDSVPGFYGECDVVVMPSFGDTWGLCVNEAMAAGRPVLGSIGAQAVEEMVAEGITGWLFDAADVPSLDSALGRRLSSTAAQRTTLGRQARATAAVLSPERIAMRIVDAFRASRGLRSCADEATAAS